MRIKKVLNVILILIIFSSILLFLLGISVTKEKGMIFPFGIVNITSGSMQPDINSGDSVIIKKSKRSDLKKGDIITFYYGNIIVTHKITEIKDNYVITKGNPENSITEIVAFDNIIGKYTGTKINGLYKFINFLKSIYGFIIFIMLPVFIIFVFEIIDLIKNLKSKKSEEKNG